MLEETILRQVQQVYDKAEIEYYKTLQVDNKNADNDTTVVKTSADYRANENREDKRAQFHLFAMATTIIAIEAIRTHAIKSKQGRELLRKFVQLPLVSELKRRLTRKGNPQMAISSGFFRPKSNNGAIPALRKNAITRAQILSTGLSPRQVGLRREKTMSAILSGAITVSSYLEEFSPAKILRTLSASHVLHSLKMSSDMPTYHIKGNTLSKMYEFYNTSIIKNGGRSLNSYDTRMGIFYDNGKIYGAKSINGKVVPNFGDVLAKGALPVFTEMDVTRSGSQHIDTNVNKIFRKHIIEAGIDPKVLDKFNSGGSVDKIAFIIGKNKADTFGKLSFAYMSKMFESGSRAIDAPFEHPAEFMEGNIRKIQNPSAKSSMARLYSLISPRFGSGVLSANGESLTYDRLLSKQAKDVLFNVTVKGMGVAIGAMALNEAVGGVFGDDYRMEQLGGDAVKNIHLGYAKMFSDGALQEYRRDQEELMPGSTSGTAPIGIIGGLAMTGAISSYLFNSGEKIKYGFLADELTNAKKPLNVEPIAKVLTSSIGASAGDVARDAFSSIQKAVSNIPVLGSLLNESHGRNTRWAIAGGIIGAALTVPILPGLIAGTPSEELERQYSGEEKVEVRTNKGWLFGGEAYEGGKIKYYDRSWYAKLKENTRDKAVYGSREDSSRLNPLLHPFSYLSNPYQFEEEHQEDQPFPVWGMDVTYGGFIGEAFEATLGKIIKPTIINPKFLAQVEDNRDEDGTFSLEKTVSIEEASLIREGKMLAPISPELSTTKLSLQRALTGAFDFGGLKGFAISTVVDQAGYFSPLTPDPHLEISGSANSLASRIKESNTGDIMGLGEAQRRIINTGAGSFGGRIENPLKNNAPSWLPGEESDFYIDFQHGNLMGKVENSDTRLPGKGYSSFYNYLKDVDPENYPLINRYEILADVALGSKEYYKTKREVEEKGKRDQLSEFEKKKASEIEYQSSERMNKKKFHDDSTLSETFSEKGVMATIAKGYWDMTSGIAQNPLQTLTPLRLGDKFLHDRTDVEDYKKDHLYGSDMALWTRPMDQFIAATVSQIGDSIGTTGISINEAEKRSTNEYFDRLEFIKQRSIYKKAREEGDIEIQREAKAKFEGTKIGAVATGLNSSQDLFAGYRSLSSKEREYFQSFSDKDTPEKRKEVLDLVSPDEGEIYSKIWSNKDKIKEFTTAEELRDFQKDDTVEYEQKMEEQEAIAKEYVTSSLGMPDEEFSGWDRRIDMKDVKLRYLQVSGKNVRDYGFWKDDELEMMRKTAILNDNNILEGSSRSDRLLDKYLDRDKIEFDTRRNMAINSVHAKTVEVRDGNGSVEFVKESGE